MTTTLRVRIAAACLVLVGLAFVQDPGFLTADTKFDLVVAPAHFLERALHLWDGQGAFGQVQNQAYGYLWPMGSFFAAGLALHVPGWVVQRLWLGLVLSVAFAGAARVSRALGVRSDLGCLTAGLAFALSPRMLSTLGPISIEAWPSALAPWVLLPLVVGSERGSPRRAAALSALAVAMVGGVNAAATFAVLPLGVVWLLTRTPGPRRRALMLWWPVFVLLATAWWLVPLALLGSYSPPFLDYIESASVTTFPTTLFDALRGTSDWVPYISTQARAGYDLLSTPYLIVDSGVVLVLGFAGLAHRRTPHRSFLALSVLLGVLMVTAGHEGAMQGWFAGEVRSQLDAVLAPLRNVHKFDPIIRLPLVVGLGLTLDRIVDAVRGASEDPRPPAEAPGRVSRLVLVGVALLAVGGALFPAVVGRIPPAGGVLAVPEYWTQTADWLEANSDGGTDLLVPGSRFADYVWGSPQDEPLQYLDDAPWAVRSAIPLAPPGNIRMLDEVEQQFAEGSGSPALVSYLARAGIDHLVVRNDLARADDVADPVLVHQAIEASPGLTLVASFGPVVGGGARLDDGGSGSQQDARVLADGGRQATYPAVEVYAVPGSAVAVGSTVTPTVVAGGPEDLLDLDRLGVVGTEPTVLATDEPDDPDDPAPGTPVVLTDGLRARERSFGRLDDGYSPVITPGDVRRTGNPVRDYLLDADDRWSTTARLDGAAAVSASLSGSDATAIGGARRGELPYAALDDDPDTEWTTAPFQSGTAWWRLDLSAPRDGGTLTLTGGASAPDNQVIRVRTAAGVGPTTDLGPDQTVQVDLPEGETSWLRIEDASGTPGRPMALAAVALPGLDVTRRLVLPTLPQAWGDPDTVVLRRDRDSRKGCVEVDADVRCLAGTSRTDEESTGMSRAVTLNGAADWTPALTVVPQGGPELDTLALQGQPVSVSASTVAVPDPRASPVAAIDGDPDTTWFASPLDLRPQLDVGLLRRQSIDSLSLDLDPDVAARAPTRVRLTFSGGQRTVTLREGTARFVPFRTDHLTITVLDSSPALSLGFDGSSQPVGIGISELRLGGVPALPLGLSADVRSYPCGSGPDVRIDDATYRSSVRASPLALSRGVVVPVRVCGASDLSLPAGEVDVDVPSTPAFGADALVLRRASATTSASSTLTALPWRRTTVTRTVDPPDGSDVVVWRQNTNPGWTATRDGVALTPVVVDGWQQAWLTSPAASGPVDAAYAPDTTYRLGLLAGLVVLGAFVLGLGGAELRRRRRARRRIVDDGPEPVVDRVVAGLVLTVVAAVGAGLVAGWPGLLVAGVVTTAVRSRPLARLDDAGLGLIPALACMVAALGYALLPWGSTAGWAGDERWPAYLMLVPLTALLVAGPERLCPPRRPSRAPRRIPGRSTKR